MTTDNEALKLAERHGTKLPQITSKDATYHIVFEPEEIIVCINEAIQTGRDQMQKELAEIEPVGWTWEGLPATVSEQQKGYGAPVTRFSRTRVTWASTPLIPQPTMPKKGE